jgi:hypothetical protein
MMMMMMMMMMIQLLLATKLKMMETIHQHDGQRIAEGKWTRPSEQRPRPTSSSSLELFLGGRIGSVIRKYYKVAGEE